MNPLASEEQRLKYEIACVKMVYLFFFRKHGLTRHPDNLPTDRELNAFAE